jgi:hypothetical protein
VIDDSTEEKFNELIQESERIYETILNTFKEMDEYNSTNELLLLGRFQEQNNNLFQIYTDLTEIIESIFKKIKK